jgi:para-aminobenzoate synthetase/4-amino-4-deoxychorismate lyase
MGVIETMLVLDGSTVLLEAHLARLAVSLDELYGALLPPPTSALVTRAATALAHGRVRVTAAPQGSGIVAVDAVASAVAPGDIFPAADRGVDLDAVAVPGGLGRHKWADRRWLDAVQGDLSSATIALLIDGEEVLETSRANLFAVAGSALITPPADDRILPGVARADAICVAGDLGIEVRERPLTLGELGRADEVFLTGSVRGVECVRTVGGRALPAPGPMVRAIAAAMRRRWTP